jgi:hypothetical protein
LKTFYLDSFRAPKRGLKNCFVKCQKIHSVNVFFAESFTLALSKEVFAECFFIWHSAKSSLPSTRKKHSAKPPALGKEVDSGSD